MHQSDPNTPIQLTNTFLKNIKVGDRLFHYPKKETPEKSFEKSPSAEYTLYRVIDLPTEEDIVLIGAFDTNEKKKSFSRSELLNGQWWYNR